MLAGANKANTSVEEFMIETYYSVEFEAVGPKFVNGEEICLI